MKRHVGLWIDHRVAVIVTMTDKVEKTMRVISDMEKRIQFSAEPQIHPGKEQRDLRFADQLGKYYDRVVSCIRDADSILILGPGKAKLELRTRLEGHSLGARVTGVETVDQMTDRQLSVRVREHFFE
jgi:stalled ribosome rescue protein Dom34